MLLIDNSNKGVPFATKLQGIMLQGIILLKLYYKEITDKIYLFDINYDLVVGNLSDMQPSKISDQHLTHPCCDKEWQKLNKSVECYKKMTGQKNLK